MPQARITVLVEDSPPREGLQAEHGLSLWIEADGMRILFDAGQTGLFIENAERLGIDLSAADAVVLSHGHYDHSGGLALLPDRAFKRIFMHPGAMKPHYRRMDAPPHKSIGLPDASMALLKRLRERVVFTPGPTRVSENIGITGEIPRIIDFENAATPYYADPECSTPDYFADDQAMWIRTDKGVVIVFGCAHAGVLNTLHFISSELKTDSLRAVIGGLHLASAGPERIQKTAEALEKHHPEFIAVGHCTGDALARQYRGHVRQFVGGVVFTF